MFRGLLKHSRCLVPASGFYEWRRGGGRKTPYYLRLKDADPFAFAGLYDVWHDADGAPLATYTLVTTAANEVVAPVHDRMPVILGAGTRSAGLRAGPPRRGTPRPPRAVPGRRDGGVPGLARVNSPAADDPSLIAPLEAESSAWPGNGTGRTVDCTYPGISACEPLPAVTTGADGTHVHHYEESPYRGRSGALSVRPVRGRRPVQRLPVPE